MILTQNQRKIVLAKIAPVCALFWLFYAMNTIVKWYSFGVVFRVLAFMGIILASLSLIPKEISRPKILLSFFVFLYYLWALIMTDQILAFLSVTMTFIPFALIVFWPRSLLKNTYELFRKVVVFYAIGSSIITILSIIGLSNIFPYIEMPAQSPLHDNNNDFYYVFWGIFPQLQHTSGMAPRACGMMEEPGHFSIILGFVYLIDRYTLRKVNISIIIAAILTFSSAFFLILLFTEWRKIFIYWKKTLVFVVGILLSVIITYKLLPADIQDLVYYWAYERNMEQVMDSFQNSGSLNDALDERTNNLGLTVYSHMSFGQKLVGNLSDEDIVLSDYRGFIVSKGIIGLILVTLISLTVLYEGSLELKVSLFLTMLMVFMHRSWFFYEPFPYCMSFIACSLYNYNMRCQNL